MLINCTKLNSICTKIINNTIFDISTGKYIKDVIRIIKHTPQKLDIPHPILLFNKLFFPVKNRKVVNPYIKKEININTRG